ncbi:MAG TPA: DUF2911 domain-containing protein [Balneolaceae bacterium]
MKASALLIKLFVAVLAVLFLFSTAAAQNQENTLFPENPHATVSQTIGNTVVSIYYGRPAIRGRKMFGQLIPFNKVWPMGVEANEATMIAFSDDVLIEGEKLKAGKYSLYTIPREDKWTLIFTNVPTQWGTYNYDSAKDALRVKVEAKKGIHIEQMMFYFTDVTSSSATVVFHWGETKVPFTVEV